MEHSAKIMPAELVVYGTTWCADCTRSKRFLGAQRVPYKWVDVDDDPSGLAFIEQVQKGGRAVPTIVFPDGAILIEPRNADLAHKLGLSQGGGSSRPADPGLSEQEGLAGGTRQRPGTQDDGDPAIISASGAGMGDRLGRVAGHVLRRLAGLAR